MHVFRSHANLGQHSEIERSFYAELVMLRFRGRRFSEFFFTHNLLGSSEYPANDYELPEIKDKTLSSMKSDMNQTEVRLELSTHCAANQRRFDTEVQSPPRRRNRAKTFNTPSLASFCTNNIQAQAAICLSCFRLSAEVNKQNDGLHHHPNNQDFYRGVPLRHKYS